MDYLKIIIASVIFFVGMGLGYKLGAWSGEEAKASLQAAVVKGNLANQDLTTTVAGLKAENVEVSRKYQDFVSNQVVAKKADEKKWTDLASTQKATIDKLKNQVGLGQLSIDLVKERLVKATTAEEKARIEKEIAAQTGLLSDAESELRGFVCLAERVPGSYIDALNSP